MACVTLKRSLDFDSIHPGSSRSPKSHKRRRCMPMCVSPQSAAAASATFAQPQSPFESASSLTPEQIAVNVRDEIRRLRRRKALWVGERGTEMEGSDESPPGSPMSPPVAAAGRMSPSQHKDKPLFTFKQVNLICERLLQERESKLKEEYEKVLSMKMAEQYDCFVRFTADQIKQRLSQDALPSCVSAEDASGYTNIVLMYDVLACI